MAAIKKQDVIPAKAGIQNGNVYRIRNIKTNDWWEGRAASAREACAKAGWNFADCEIKTKSDYGYGGWKKCTEN